MDDIARRDPQRRIHTGRRFTERLTDLKARRLTKPGRHADGGRLYLFVSKSGSKSWVFVFTRDGKKRELGLGAYPDTSLAAARAKAKEHREALAEGRMPRSGKEAVQAARQVEAAAVMTVGAACDEFIALMAPSVEKKHRVELALLARGSPLQVTSSDVYYGGHNRRHCENHQTRRARFTKGHPRAIDKSFRLGGSARLRTIWVKSGAF
jgi:hypothetical protein